MFLRLRQEAATTSPTGDASRDHVVDRLHKLADLLDRGIVTEEEFDASKQTS